MQFFFFRIWEAFFIKVKMEIMCIDEIQIFSERAEVTDLQRFLTINCTIYTVTITMSSLFIV